jgi:Phosphoglycerate dehydrogenase and related dehydrogenases
MRIVSTLGLDEKYREQLKKEFPHLNIEHVPNLQGLSEKQLAEVEILLTYGNGMSEDTVEKMKSLRWVHSGQAGIEAMPRHVLEENGVIVTNSKGINSVTIAEYVICMLLNIERKAFRFYEAYKKRHWDTDTRLDEIFGKTMGIIGLGKVGQELAKRAKAFEINVYGMDRTPVQIPFIDRMFTPDCLKEIAAECDYLVICIPLTDETYHMIDKDVFMSMKPTSVLVNVGRGAVIDMEDLIEAVQNHVIGGAILDVFEEEPLQPDHILWQLDNVMITPHIAGDRQPSYMPRMMKILCDNLRSYPSFKAMKNLVNIKLGF